MRPRLRDLVAVLLLTPAAAGATSVFSAWGLGEDAEGMNPRVAALGRLALAVPSQGRPAFHNPASMASLRLACFGVSFSPEVTWLESDDASNRLVSTAMPTVDLAVPLGPRGVGWFGLRQVTAVGYNAVQDDSLEGAAFTRKLSREGGLHAVAAGVALPAARWLWVGAEARFIFGSILEKRFMDFSSTLFDDTEDEQTASFRGTVWRLGVLLHPAPFLTLGGTLGTPRELSVSYETVNTLGVERSWGERVRFPASVGAGIAVKPWGPVTLSADWSETRWGATRWEQTGQVMENTTAVGFGLEIAASRAERRRFVRQFPIRLGYARVPWYTRHEQDARPAENRYSLGTSVPLLGKRGFVDITVEYGLRDASGIREELLRFQFGAVGFERWARQYE